jgi:glutamine amidotransferase
MSIAIIDYGAGNLGNVTRAARRAGLNCIVTGDAKALRDADALILPGVGAMGDAMDRLNAAGLTEEIRNEVKAGKKLVGICLGMQALFEVSEEGGEVEGLGLIPGRIVRFPAGPLKVPHMGWNELRFRRDHWTSRGLPPHPYVYFVHSYYKTPTDTDDVIAVADYGVEVPAIVAKDNVAGFQFHPEKSGEVGIQLWKNIAEWLTE